MKLHQEGQPELTKTVGSGDAVSPLLFRLHRGVTAFRIMFTNTFKLSHLNTRHKDSNEATSTNLIYAGILALDRWRERVSNAG
jgi:hypothetical protein